MTRHFFQGDCVAIESLRYRLEAVLPAYEHLIDALCEGFECSMSTVTTTHKGFDQPIRWPDPGKDMVRLTWRRCAEHHDVIDASLIHHVGPLTVKAFLLGKTWLVYLPENDRLSTPTDGDVHELDPVPVVCVYGEDHGGGKYGLVSSEHIAAVQTVFEKAGPLLGLDLEVMSASNDDGQVVGYMAYIKFRDTRFQGGTDSLRVKVVQRDGSPIPESCKAPVN